ncbi:MAG: hypothetical protein R2831_12270 [Chitinophagaceae bacterium]
MLENIRYNKYPHDAHRMTGPSVYTEAINSCLLESPTVSFRQLKEDYDKKIKFSYRMSKLFLYGIYRREHWKKVSQIEPVLKYT